MLDQLLWRHRPEHTVGREDQQPAILGGDQAFSLNVRLAAVLAERDQVERKQVPRPESDGEDKRQSIHAAIVTAIPICTEFNRISLQTQWRTSTIGPCSGGLGKS